MTYAVLLVLLGLSGYLGWRWYQARVQIQELESDLAAIYDQAVESAPSLTDLARLSTQLAGHSAPDPDWQNIGIMMHPNMDRAVPMDELREVARARSFAVQAEDPNLTYAEMVCEKHAEKLGISDVSILEDTYDDRMTVNARHNVIVYTGPVVIDQMDRLETFETWIQRDLLNDYMTSLRFDDRDVMRAPELNHDE